MWLELCINFNCDLLETQRLINDDRWQEGRIVTEALVFDRICMVSPTVVESVMGLYPRCSGKLHSLE
jgi:hypothetical protein